MQATDTMLSVLLRYTENLWDGIMKTPELTKGFISSKFVGDCLHRTEGPSKININVVACGQ